MHVSLLAVAVALFASIAPGQGRIDVLFLGDRGHHRPAARMKQVHVAMAARGIDLFYTDRVADLNPETLRHYDCVVLYANHTVLPKRNEQALLEFVESGKGFVPLHCGSACFGNSPRFVALVGGQFRRHGTGVFAVRTVKPEHPAMRGVPEFSSWDETYVHGRLTADREVLQFRPEADGRQEPWTWVREQGQGRVFYTAWGHDQRTWSNAGFHDLLERGIRWASGDRFVDRRPPAPGFEYQPAEVPHYQVGVSRRDMKNLPTMQKPLTPEASQRRLRVPAEFRVERFAAEPQIMKPIAMTWDERGRLWIAETRDYPNDLQKAGEGHDRIKICEDTDGDGVADKFTVFADKLSIPTSLVHARGGLIVAQAPHFLFLKDTDGDDRADVREVLFTGWSTGDTHAGPSNLRYGFDNQVWGSVGYAGYRGRIGDEEHSFRQGFFRFEPDGSRLEFLISTTNNTWGLAFSEDGHVFGSTANGNPSVYMAIPNRYYETVSGWSAPRLATIAETTEIHPITDKVRQVDWHGKFTAAAGHAIYTARQFPKRYWNRAAFVNAPTGHLLNQFFLERQGTHFITRDGFNLLASDDEWTAPIMAEVGPDGALWVIDWYNYIVQHNPTPPGFKTGRGNAYETPLRDKRHGRIYRVLYRGRQPGAVLDLSRADTAQLVAALGNDNLFWRLTAQRLLVERRPADAAATLQAVLGDRKVDELGLNVAVQHALWALHGLGAIGELDPATQRSLLGHPAPAVRRVAVTVLPAAAVVAQRAALLADDDLHVRLATLLALSAAPPDPAVGQAVFDVLQDARNSADRWIPDAATAAAVRHGAGFLGAALEKFVVDSAGERKAPVNLLPNPGFEEQRGGQPVGWRVRTYGGDADHQYVQEGRNGSWCVKISSARGSDTSWYADIPVEPGATYRFTGWIKTAGLQRHRGGANGALFNAHELQGGQPVKTRGLLGDQDWTRMEVTFSARGLERIGINCLFGGWGHAVGTAWFDDLRLQRVQGQDLPGKLGGTVGKVMAQYAASGPVDTVWDLLGRMRKASPGLALHLLRGLQAGWPAGARPALGETQRAFLRQWLPELPPGMALELLGLLRSWGHAEAFHAETARLVDRLHRAVGAAEDVGARVQAAEQVVDLASSLPVDQARSYVSALLVGIRPQMEQALAVGLLRAVGRHPGDWVGSGVLQQWNRFTGPVQKAAAAVLMRRAPWTGALLEAIAAGKVDGTALSGAQWAQLGKHPDATIRAKAASARNNKPSELRGQVLQRFAAVAGRRGDAAKGKALFQTHCTSCHRLGGAGGRLGPELDGIGARSRQELLVAILDPNQSVDGTYLMWVVETKGGEFYAGRLDAESKTTIEIRDVEDKRHVIKRSDIATMESSKISLMPAIFETLGEPGLTDLLEFLATQKQEHK